MFEEYFSVFICIIRSMSYERNLHSHHIFMEITYIVTIRGCIVLLNAVCGFYFLNRSECQKVTFNLKIIKPKNIHRN